MKNFIEWLQTINEVIQTPPMMMHLFINDNINKIKDIEKQLRPLESIINKASKIAEIYYTTGGSDDLRDLWYLISYNLPVRLKGKLDKESYSERINSILKLYESPGVNSADVTKYLKGAMLTRGTYPSRSLPELKQSIANILSKRDEASYLDGVIQGIKSDWNEEWNKDEGLDLSKEQSIEAIKKVKDLIKLVDIYVKTIENFEKGFDSFLEKGKRGAEKYYSSAKIRDRGLSIHSDLPPEYGNVEVLFHATPFMKEIKQSGLRVGEQKALGGEVEDAISFTADVNIAREIVRAFREAIAIAKGQVSPEDVILMGKKEGVNIEQLEAYKWYIVDKNNGYKRSNKSEKDHAFELYKSILALADRRYDPLFFGVRAENFSNMDPRNVGIIAAKVNMSKVKTYMQAMEEYRVPPDAIISFKTVPS